MWRSCLTRASALGLGDRAAHPGEVGGEYDERSLRLTAHEKEPGRSADVERGGVLGVVVDALLGAGLAAVFLSVLQSASILVIPSQWQGSLTYFVLFVVILFFPTGFRLPAWFRRMARAT